MRKNVPKQKKQEVPTVPVSNGSLVQCPNCQLSTNVGRKSNLNEDGTVTCECGAVFLPVRKKRLNAKQTAAP